MGRMNTAYDPPPHILTMSTYDLQAVVYRDNPDLRCRVLPPDRFFASRTIEYARDLCGACPILAECAELAIRDEMTEVYFNGVRGGMAPAARRIVVRQRRGLYRPTEHADRTREPGARIM